MNTMMGNLKIPGFSLLPEHGIHLGRFRKGLLHAILALLTTTGVLKAQYVEELVVETYYITDANDAASATSDGILPGTVTYRLFLDLCAGCKLKRIYANSDHELRIESTEPFFNTSIGATYGHDLNGALFSLYDSAPLDSYISFGAASTVHLGVHKSSDPDGSIWQNRNPPQALSDESSDAGVPITDSDGLLSAGGQSTTPIGWILPPNNGDATAVFGNGASSNSFVSQNIIFQSSAGTPGQNPDNVMLIAQLTTLGDIAFELNIQILDSLGVDRNIVAVNPLNNEILSPYLSYPRACGCTDSDFLEYDVTALCDDGSCATTIVFGCLNEEACNFNEMANFDIPELCCFVDSCQGLDPSLICPTLSTFNEKGSEILLFPNPASNTLYIDGLDESYREGIVAIVDLTGRVIANPEIELGSETVSLNVDGLVPGTYVLILESQGHFSAHRFQIIR